MKIYLKYLLQKYANFLVTRLEVCKDQKEFDIWFQQALFLESFCQSIGVELD